MWSSAPDGGCVGTGSRGPDGPRGGSRETLRRDPRTRRATPQTSGVIPHRTDVVRAGPPRVRGLPWPPACHAGRAMPDVVRNLPLAADGYPAAGGGTRPPAGPDQAAPAHRGRGDAAAPAHPAPPRGGPRHAGVLGGPGGPR